MKRFSLILSMICIAFCGCRVSVIDTFLVEPERIEDSGNPGEEKVPEEESENQIKPCEKKMWTLMFYMSGDNNLAAEVYQDINEMEAACVSQDQVNIVCLTDVSSYYGLNPSGSRMFLVKPDQEASPYIVSEEIPLEGFIETDGNSSLNMADGNTLLQFMDFCDVYFPSDNKALFIWGHGSGWRSAGQDFVSASRAVAFDDGSRSYMEISTLRNAIEKKTEKQKLDLICFDTCFGSELEIVYELKDVAEWFCGAEGLVSSSGLDYSRWLSEWDYTSGNGKDLAQCIRENSTGFGIFDCSKSISLFRKFDSLAGFCAGEILSGEQSKEMVLDIRNCIRNSYVNGTVSDLYIDIFELTKLLSKKIPSCSRLALGVQDELKEAMLISGDVEFLNQALGVYFCSVDSSNSIIKKYSEYYIHGSGKETQPLFVKDSIGYVPTRQGKDSFLDKLVLGE